MGIPQRMISYYGKQLDNIAAVLLMALEFVGITDVPHPDCLTSRPFCRRSPLDKPQLWLAPFTDPWSSLLLALDNLGIRNECRIVTTVSADDQGTDILATIERWLQDGPVILGPLNRTLLWDRIKSRYNQGAAHFVLVLENGSGRYLIVHDPEGCPYSTVSSEKLVAALQTALFEGGALQVQSASDLYSRDQVFRQAFLAGVRICSVSAIHPEGGANGLRALAQEIAFRKLKSSEEAALNFAIPALGLALKQVIEFLFDFPCSVSNDLPHWGSVEPQILEVLNEYCVDCAYALEYLKVHDQRELSDEFVKMASNEELLARLFSFVTMGEVKGKSAREGYSR